MPLEVNPAHIKSNEKEATEMEEALEKVVKVKDKLLDSFIKKMKKLEKDEKEMREIVTIAHQRCKFHHALKEEVELRLAGKRKASLEKEDDRRVKDFIDVVKKEDVAKFQKLLEEFVKDLTEIKDSLK